MTDDDGSCAPDDVARLLAFLRDRDVACPVCRYNLRDLTVPVCPECHQNLELTVGARSVRLGWFIATIAPMIFSGIAAAVLLIPILAVPISGGGPAPPFIMALDGFGWLSGVTGLVLMRHRLAFIGRPARSQRIWAIVAWAAHVGLFGLLLTIVLGW